MFRCARPITPDMRSGREMNSTDAAQLTALGIQPASISFQTLTLESDHFICV